MLKRMLALTLALVMAIMPMTASAVTWGEVVSGLNAKIQAGGNYYYDAEEDIYAGYNDEYSLVNVSGTGTITGDVILITSDTVKGVYEYYFNGVKLDADQIKIEVDDYLMVGFGEDTVVNGDVVGEAEGEYGYVHLSNAGTINGDMSVTGAGGSYNEGTVGDMTVTVTRDGASGGNSNYGTAGDMTVTVNGAMTAEGEYAQGYNDNFGTAGDMTATAAGDYAQVGNYNYGTAGDMTVTAAGKGSEGYNSNNGMTGVIMTIGGGASSEQGIAGDMTAIASGKDSEVSNYNWEGTVGDMTVIASGEGSYADNYSDYGTAGDMNAEANAEGALVWNNAYESEIGEVTAEASNGGTVVNEFYNELESLTAVIGEGGTVIAGYMDGEEDPETGDWIPKPEVDSEMVNAKKITVVIEAGAEDTYTADQIKALIAATGMTPTETVYYTVNAQGERTAEYSIGTDGSLTFVRKLIEEYTAEELEYIKKMDKIARENHEREIKRHAEKLGGITASPEWVKQLFIGYMSLNLRMYEEGEQILFRERLAWADTDDGTLNLTLRVNIDEPKALTIRLDENVLDKLEQANISVVTLLAKDGTPVMQYKVSDLRGAYTQYGLTGTDLLVVGGADDDVMKIGADGVMKPVEAE